MNGTPYNNPGTAGFVDLLEWMKQNAGNNEESLARVKRNLSKAIQQELTPSMRTYLQMYFFDRKTMKEIGDACGVDKSTVCRGITRACNRLYHVLQYSF